MRRSLIVGPLLVAATAPAAVAATPSGARTVAHTAGAQLCRFSFIHHVTRATGRRGWEVRFGARIACRQSTNRLELGGTLVSWGVAKDCRQCGAGWYVTSAFTRPIYKKAPGTRTLTVTGRYFERSRHRHLVWVDFAVQPVGSRLLGFHDTNTRKCQKQSADFYGCDGFSREFR